MPATERPKSRLDDGRINPEYTAWRKANILGKGKAGEAKGLTAWLNEDSPQLAKQPLTDQALNVVLDQVFASSSALVLKGTKTTKNAMFVMATSPDEEGCSVPVRLLKKGTGAKLIKKEIKVERRDGQFFQIR